MTPAISFSRQNDTGSRSRTLLSSRFLEKIVVAIVLLLEYIEDITRRREE